MEKDERRAYCEIVLQHIHPGDILEYYGTTVHDDTRESPRGGVEFDGTCPFHDSIRMNFSMHSELGVWLCRSATCGLTGDILRFVELQEGCDFHEAYRHLCEMADIEVQVVNPLTLMAGALAKLLEPPRTPEDDTGSKILPWPEDYEVMAHPYLLRKRRISEPVLLKAKAGWLTNTPFHKYRASIPVVQKGKLRTIYSRAISSEKAWTKAHPSEAHNVKKYFPKHHYKGETLSSQLLYGLDDVLEAGFREVILVEAIISVLRLRSLGVFNAMAMLKARLSREQVRLLVGTFDRIWICNDNDLREDADGGGKINPGMSAAWKNFHRLKEYAEIGLVKMPVGIDPADLDDLEIFDEAKKRALWVQRDVRERQFINEFMRG